MTQTHPQRQLTIKVNGRALIDRNVPLWVARLVAGVCGVLIQLAGWRRTR